MEIQFGCSYKKEEMEIVFCRWRFYLRTLSPRIAPKIPKQPRDLNFLPFMRIASLATKSPKVQRKFPPRIQRRDKSGCLDSSQVGMHFRDL